jgi:hypothetical protein
LFWYSKFSPFNWRRIKTILWASINEDPTRSLGELVDLLAEGKLDVSKERKICNFCLHFEGNHKEGVLQLEMVVQKAAIHPVEQIYP